MCSRALLASVSAEAWARSGAIEGTFTGHSAAGAAILIVETGVGTIVEENQIGGNADVGIHILADAVTVSGNSLRDTGPDGLYDVGIVNRGSGNLFFQNSVHGFRTSTLGTDAVAPISGQQIE